MRADRGRTSENTFLAALFERPYPDGRVIACGSELTIIRTEAQTPDSLAVPLPRSEVIHVRLEVLDDPALVR